METHHPLPMGQQVMITLGLRDQLIDVMGKIVYTAHDAGRHHSGIAFFHLSDRDKHILDKYVSAFHQQYASDAGNHPLQLTDA